MVNSNMSLVKHVGWAASTTWVYRFTCCTLMYWARRPWTFWDLVEDHSYLLLWILELCCFLMLVALHQSTWPYRTFPIVLLSVPDSSLCKYDLLGWVEMQQFQSVYCRHDRVVSTARLTRSAGLWIILLLFLSGNIHSNPGPELNWTLTIKKKK